MISGAKQFVDFASGKLRLAIIFEVVDDPQDDDAFRHTVKPVDVWFAFSKDPHALPFEPSLLRDDPKSTFVPGLTKHTAREARQFAWVTTAAEGSYLYVLCAATPEWSHLYGHRVYKLKVEMGRTFNVAVSVPRLPRSATEPPTSEPATTPAQSGATRRGFNP